MIHVLCTGGAGYIGGHCAFELVESGHYKVTIVDNLINATEAAVKAIKNMTNGKVEFMNVDLVTECEKLEKVDFDAVIHFAALKAVGESVEKPLEYYENNIRSLLNVLKVMKKKGKKVFVFSSSATVYRPSEQLLTESSPIGASNPYGQTKVIGEQILRDLFASDNTWKISLLRYFNPIGCHPSGTFGESPKVPLNLLPIIQQVAVGKRDALTVAGTDWPTRDGTGIRDYIHVLDLSEGHVQALDQLAKSDKGCVHTYNLGTGHGVSVLEMVSAFEKASGVKVKTIMGPRRPGDLATVVADPAKAEKELGFKAKRSTDEACKSAWLWQSTHPDGFDASS